MTLDAMLALHLLNLSLPRDRAGRLCLPPDPGLPWLRGNLLAQVRSQAQAGDFIAVETAAARAAWRYSGKLVGLARTAGLDFLLRDTCLACGPAAAIRTLQAALCTPRTGTLTAGDRAVLAGAEVEPAPVLRALARARGEAGSDPERTRTALRLAMAFAPRCTSAQFHLTGRVA